MKKILFVLFGTMIMLGLSLTGCDQNPSGEKATTGTETKTAEVKGLEKYLYSSADELDLLYSRGIGDVVDWTLARELAEIELEDMQLAGEFETTTFLREFPIAIYDAEGAIKYYEFRVCSEAGDAIGAITTVAKESEGYPIAFKLLFPESYSDSLELLFHQGKVSEDDMLRVVANDYPNYAIGVIESTRGENDVTELYASDNGESLTTEEIAEPVRLDILLAENPELEAEVGAEAIAEMEVYKAEVAEFWSAVTPHKGTLRDVNTRGRTRTLEKYYVPNYWGDGGIREKSAGWLDKECGPSAITFTLGYMSEQGLIDGYDASTWTDFDKVRKAVKLVSKGAFKGATWPWNIDDGIRAIAPHYKVVQKGWGIVTLGIALRSVTGLNPWSLGSAIVYDKYSTWNSVKQSVRVDKIPGISLRGLSFKHIGNGPGWQPHYRNVVGYQVTEKRWWFFRWRRNEMRIHDHNGYDNGWERYSPLYHWQYYRITKR